jgi:hypothetical protein
VSAPIVETYDGFLVARDDLYPGGTKSRFVPQLFEDADEVVYATPAQGGAQFALAYTAHRLGKRCTLFVAERKQPHDRAWEAKALGATIVQVSNGYLSVVQARARAYCEATGTKLAPFGMDLPEAVEAIAAAALQSGAEPTEVWCAGGSGVLGRALSKAWPRASINVVMVGRKAEPVPGAKHIFFPKPFEWRAEQPPFPSDPHYDAKVWQTMTSIVPTARRSRCLMWNVAGPAIKKGP